MILDLVLETFWFSTNSVLVEYGSAMCMQLCAAIHGHELMLLI